MTRSRLCTVLMMSLALLMCAGASVAQPLIDQVGNLNPPAGTVPGLLTGDQMFAYLIDPDVESSCSTTGFMLEAVHMYIEFDPTQVPATFQVSAGLADAVFDPTGQNLVPGGDVCVSPIQTITITTPGLHQVTVPVVPSCGCLPIDEDYFLTFNIFGEVQGQLVIDNQPQPHVVYWNNVGGVWEDMFDVDKTSGGKVIIWGDIVCCSAPIGNEDNTWGEVKSLFR